MITICYAIALRILKAETNLILASLVGITILMDFAIFIILFAGIFGNG